MDRQEASGLNSVRVSFQGNGQTRQKPDLCTCPGSMQSLHTCALIFSLVSTHCANRTGQGRVHSLERGIGVHRLHRVPHHSYPIS